MKVRVDRGILIESNQEIPLSESYGEWTGIAKISSAFSEVLLERIGILMERGHHQAYDTLDFSELASDGHAISIAEFTGLPWVEIDTWEDLELARQLFRQ